MFEMGSPLVCFLSSWEAQPATLLVTFKRHGVFRLVVRHLTLDGLEKTGNNRRKTQKSNLLIVSGSEKRTLPVRFLCFL